MIDVKPFLSEKTLHLFWMPLFDMACIIKGLLKLKEKKSSQEKRSVIWKYQNQSTPWL